DTKALEIESDQSLLRPIAGLRVDLSERSGIDIQARICRRRMVEHIVRIQTERQMFRLTNTDALLDIRIERPHSRPFNRTQAEGTELPGRRIPQDDISIGVGERVQRAPLRQI